MSAQGCISWQGECAQADEQFNGFLQGPVAARLNDAEGGAALLAARAALTAGARRTYLARLDPSRQVFGA